MTTLVNKTLRRVTVFLSAAMLGACISVASTLPGPIDKSVASVPEMAPSSLLPTMLDASASYADTGNSAPADAAEGETGATQGSPAQMPHLSARVASGDLAAVGNAQPDHNGCTPEPVTTILMASGILGLFAVRRLGQSDSKAR